MKKYLKYIPLFMLLIAPLFFAGCSNTGNMVRHNLEIEEQNFRVYRRVVFYNAIQDKYILTVEGYLAVNIDMDGDVVITIKQSDGTYLKHYLGQSAGVVYFSEALDSNNVAEKRYKVIFNPVEIIPTIEMLK